MTVVVVIHMSNCPKALRFVNYYTDYEAERLFSHVIQVVILIFYLQILQMQPKT